MRSSRSVATNQIRKLAIQVGQQMVWIVSSIAVVHIMVTPLSSIAGNTKYPLTESTNSNSLTTNTLADENASPRFAELREQWQHPEQQVPIRMNYSREACRVFICPPRPTEVDEVFKRPNEAVGIPIAQGSASDFEYSLIEILKFKSKAELTGSVVYIAGVDFQDEARSLELHHEVLKRHGLDQMIRLKSIPISKNQMSGWTLDSLRILRQRIASWFPGIKRHYEPPNLDEVLVGLAVTAAIESGNAYYLWNTLPPLDATITLVSHFTLLSIYTVYTKSLVNWLLSPESGNSLKFLKQLSLSLPFIINYQIFANLTPMTEFIGSHNVQETLNQLGDQMAKFVGTQWLTVGLQTGFYYAVITRTIGEWMNQVKGDHESDDARVWRKVLEAPVLFLNAIALAIASGTPGTRPLVELGPLIINNGHAMLGALTLGGVGTYRLIANPSFQAYRWLKRRVTSSCSQSLMP